ncbi:ATP-binding protein [Sphaerimonospora cavernae]|uniref:histidine kinase n=1 Tax=Sphaerimonospora cavernae TaxID=1740611 RepID=A0ABV6UBZ8_9ACTN
MHPPTARLLTASATLLVAVSAAVNLMSETPSLAALSAAGVFAVVIGWVIVVRLPDSPVGPALAWCSGSVGLVDSFDATAAGAFGETGTAFTDRFGEGIWPVNLLGLLALLLVFPDGRRRGRLWTAAPVAFATGAVLVFLGLGTGDEPAGAPLVLVLAGLPLVGLGLILAVASVFVRYRRSSELQRLQLRWLLLAGSVVAVLLVGGWAAEVGGAPLWAAYSPFIFGIVVLVPLAIGIAIVRHDLFDIDRILGDGAAWVLTLVASAAVFAAVVFGAGQILHRYTAIGSTAAAFLTALVLLPIHRFVRDRLARVIDRDRFVAVKAVEEFAAQVRAGRRQPEEVEAVLRDAQGDPGLSLLLADGDRWVDLDGEYADDQEGVTLAGGSDPLARVVLTHVSARTRRRAAALAHAAWVPIEVSRLRLSLHRSNERLVHASAAERRRLERDLHDGAQQRILATGMRLRSLQRGLVGEQAAEVEAAVTELEETVRELRRLAHGVRPSRLDDGLAPALEHVREATPLPVHLAVDDLPALDDIRALTAYLVVTEAVSNVLKHARASRIDVTVRARGERLAVQVRDDGVGGAPDEGSLTALRDRVTSAGGTLTVTSPLGRGTDIEAVL